MENEEKSFEILRIKCVEEEYKDYKKAIAFLAGFGILGTLTSALSLGTIAKYNMSINSRYVENRVLYALGIFNIPVGALGIAGAINEYKHMKEFKKENDYILSRKK